MKIGSSVVLEADNYVAELIDYTDTKQDGTPLMSSPYQGVGEPKPQWRLTFELLEVEGHQLSAWVNKPADEGNIHAKSKIVELVKALLPDVKPGQEWDFPDLLHQQCRLQVEVYDKTDGSKANKVTGFLPPRTGNGQVAAPPSPARAVPRQEPVPTVAQRRAAAVVEPTLDPESVPF